MSEAAAEGASMTPVQRGTLTATILGSTTVFIDGTVVTIALAAIGMDLPASMISVLEGQTYVVSGYFATLAALLLLSGALSDRYGRRRIYAIGLAGFGLTSILCGFAPTLELLAVFRLLQGAAGALLVPGSLSVITATFDESVRPRAIGIWAAATSAATIAGPLVGSVLVDSAGWRWIFLINIPILAVALWLTLRYVPESRAAEAPARFDWPGALIVCLAVGGIALGAIRGRERGWDDPVAIAALVIGLVALLLVPVLMTRRTDPLVPPGIFRGRVFLTVNVSTFLLYGALYVSFQFIYLFLIGVAGYSPLGAALATMPTSLMLALLSTRIGTVAGRIGARPFLVAGPLIVGVAFVWLSMTPPDASPWRPSLADPASLVPPAATLGGVLGASFVFGIGMALVVAPLTTTLMGSIPVSQAGLGSAINNAISRVGQPFLAAVAFILVTGIYYSSLAAAVPTLDLDNPVIRATLPPLNQPLPPVTGEVAAAADAASAAAYRLVMLLCACLAVAAAAVNLRGLPARNPR